MTHAHIHLCTSFALETTWSVSAFSNGKCNITRAIPRGDSNISELKGKSFNLPDYSITLCWNHRIISYRRERMEILLESLLLVFDVDEHFYIWMYFKQLYSVSYYSLEEQKWKTWFLPVFFYKNIGCIQESGKCLDWNDFVQWSRRLLIWK